MLNLKLCSRVSMAVLGATWLLLLGTGSGLAEKDIFTETYDLTTAAPLSQPQPCEGLDLNGVTYSFSIAGAPSQDCTVGTMTGPGDTNDVQAPNIEGNAAGVLHLKFDVPTTQFGFGVALSTQASPQPQAVIIDLYRPGVGLLRQELSLTATSDPLFVGGHFDYHGPAIRTATIQFANGPYSRFAFDNLAYFRPPGQAKQ